MLETTHRSTQGILEKTNTGIHLKKMFLTFVYEKTNNYQPMENIARVEYQGIEQSEEKDSKKEDELKLVKYLDSSLELENKSWKVIIDNDDKKEPTEESQETQKQWKEEIIAINYAENLEVKKMFKAIVHNIQESEHLK